MKRIITSAFVILLTIGAAQAQTTPGEKGHGHKKEQKMAFDDLNLTADQKSRLQSIREDFKKGMTDLKNNNSLSAEEKQARRKTLHEQFRSQSEAVLTPAQKDQMAKKKAEWKSTHKEGVKGKGDRMAKGKGFERGKKMQEELGLTSEQQQKVSSIHSEFRPKFEALRNDNSLNKDQKKEKMRQLMQQQQEQMKSVLTPEQVQKMQNMHQQRDKK